MKTLFTIFITLLTLASLNAQTTEKVTILETHGVASNNLQNADFNNDGIKDFITHYGSMFRIHFSDGGEEWTNTVEVNPGTTLTFETYIIKDVNGDNYDDIVYSNVGYSASIKWLENPTDGSDYWVTHTLTGSYRSLIGVFDVNGDLQPDIVYENWLGNLGWVKNVAGSFTLFNAIPDSYAETKLWKVEDFDQDGDDDMVLFFDYCCLDYFENNSDGTFAVSVVSPDDYQNAIYLIDYNADGFNDIVTQYGTEFEVATFNNITGGFTPETAFGILDAQTIAVADIDGDSDEDFICMISNLVTGFFDLFWRENTGDVTLTALSLVMDSVSEVESAFNFYDYNGDLKADLFGSNNGRMYVQLSDMPTNEFLSSFNPDYIYLRMDLIRYFDVNNDSQTDIMLANRDGVVGWIEYDLINDTVSNVHHLPKIEASPYPVDMIEADLDNDADFDLIISYKSFYGGSQITYYFLNDGEGNFTMHEFSSDAFAQMHVLDTDEDGDIDLIGYDVIAKSIKVFVNSGDTTNIFSTWVTVAASTVNGFDLADIDNDGDLDIIYSKTWEPQIQIAYNEPAIHFAAGIDAITHDCTTAALIYTDDFDNNGFEDIGYSCSTGPLKVCFNTDGVFTSVGFGAGKGSMPFGPSYTDDFDINNDGFNDLIAADFINGTYIKLSSGPGTYLESNYLYTKDYGHFLYADTNHLADFIGTNDNELYILYDINFIAPDVTITEPTFEWIEEGGTGSSVSVFANTIPNHVLQIICTPDPIIDAGAGAGSAIVITLLPDSSSLIPQTINFTVPDDAIVENIVYKTYSITTPYDTWGMYAGMLDDVDTFLIADNDLGIFVSAISVALSEGLLPINIYFNINKIATDPVTVTLTPGTDINLNGIIGGIATIDIPSGISAVATYSFNVANPNDVIDELNILQHVNYLFNSADLTIDGFSPTALNVTLTDNDIANVVRNISMTNIVEAIDTMEFQLELNTAPTQDVFIEITPDEQLDLGFGVGVSQTLVFPASLFVPDQQSVFVLAINDGIVEDMHIGKLTFNIYSADPFYDDETLGILNLYIMDQETTGVSIETETQTAAINIFPGIGNGSFEIDIKEAIDYLIVYNAMGQVVHFEALISIGKHNLDLTLLSAGIYYITARNQSLNTAIPIQIVK